MAIKIAITDDHPLILSGLKSMLQYQEDMHVIGTYECGDELLEGLYATQPDVLLLDVQMAGMKGDEIAKIVTKRYPSIAILALTNLDSPYYIKSMLQHERVLGYMLKTSREHSLVKAIRAVANGEKYLEPIIKQSLTAATRPGHNDAIQYSLTRREKEVLELLACDFSSQDIGERLFIGKRTVDNYRVSLLLKFGVKNTAGLVKKAMDLGLIK